VAAITIYPASGSITAKSTVCRVTVATADSNDISSYSTAVYPTSPELRYYLLFDAPVGTDDKKSYEFTPSADGDHVFNNFIFDAAGSWTIRLRNADTDADVTTTAVTVA